ncbi:hypothetical protein HL10_gp152 [Cronobacter phage CR8]|uniref:Uncharacterized protein n=1 Tax=Cronobacter phage CR8 TaxID=1327934 RepID=A0A060AM33_9CAUD|nr:hypothetical protein HL10_gp152 [Cronobacter phage CR8]AIA64682.1 hypothetical protein CR8_152 [Cronobacter phage CR8]
MTTFNALHLRAFIAGYFEALYFAESATGNDGEEIDNLAGYELSATAKEEGEQACARFLDWHGEKVNLAIAGSDDYDHTQAGRDFWFTRQGHGVGFWDRGLGMVGDDLSDAARSFGEKHVFIDDDGLIGVE